MTSWVLKSITIARSPGQEPTGGAYSAPPGPLDGGRGISPQEPRPSWPSQCYGVMEGYCSMLAGTELVPPGGEIQRK